MNYIYDILLNFKDNYYDFYDWNSNDNIIHIRKIPIFKISTIDLMNIKNNKIKFDCTCLEEIENRTEIFTNKGVKKIRKACLLSDGNTVIAINILNRKVKISSMLVDEELDALEDVYTLDLFKINYIVINKREKYEFKTRKQKEEKMFLKRELSKINDDEKIKYLYYECFNKKEENTNKIIVELNEVEDEKIVDKLYSFLRLIKVNNE